MSTNGTFLQRNEGRLSPDDIKLYYQKLNEKNAKSITVLPVILSEENVEKLFDAIEVQFLRKDARKLGIKHADFLDLYVRIYEEGLRRFNFVELGIISDMFFVDYPPEVAIEIFETTEEYLKFKVVLEVLPQTYHAISTLIDSEITQEFKIRKQLQGNGTPPILTGVK